MTLADYSVSGVAFDQMENWKNMLKQLVTACNNNTEALATMIPQLEAFIYVARGELVCIPPISLWHLRSARFMFKVDI